MTIFNVLVRFSWGDTNLRSFEKVEDAIDSANKMVNAQIFTEDGIDDTVFDSETGDIREVQILSSRLY